MDFKSFCNVGTSKHLDKIQPLLQCLKGMTLLVAPSLILVLACKHSERFGNQGELLDKSSITVCQSKDNMKLWNVVRCWDL